MLVAQTPISDNQLYQRPRSGRKPLQPKNSPSTPFDTKLKPNLSLAPIFWGEVDQNNKENIYSTPVKKECIRFQHKFESFDASFTEELGAIREKVERMWIDKEKTDKMLRKRESVLA